MTKPFRKIFAAVLLTTASVWLAAAPAAAEAPKPALTITFAGYDQLTSDLKAIDQIDSHLGLATKLDDFLNKAASGVLDGLDKSRPWGVMVYVRESDDPTVLGYLPVTNLKKLMAALPVPGGETPTANSKGVYKIPSGPRTIYVKQKGAWAVLADDEGMLDDAGDDPQPQISDLAKKYSRRRSRQRAERARSAARPVPQCALRGMVQLAMATQGVNEDQQGSVKQAFDQIDKLSKEAQDAGDRFGLRPRIEVDLPRR